MCNIFSGHISFKKGNEWGKIYYFTGVHHEEDRKKISHDEILAWETKKEADYSDGIGFTHYSHLKLTKKELKSLENLVMNWSKTRNIQKDLKDIVKNDESYDARFSAIKNITDQNFLKDIAKNDDGDDYIRSSAVENIIDQNFLKDIAKNDKFYNIRLSAVKNITDQNFLKDIAKNDKFYAVRLSAVENIIDQKFLKDIAKNDDDCYVRSRVESRLKKL